MASSKFLALLSVACRALMGEGGMLATDAVPSTSSSAFGECVEVPLDREDYVPGRGSGQMQKMTSFEETCSSWNPNPAEEPPRPAGCLGPLEQLIGTWKGIGHAYTWVPLTPMPGLRLQGPMFTSTPQYTEILTIKPIAGTVLNKGYQGDDHLHPQCSLSQALQGVSYTQEVRIEYTGDPEFHQLVHMEKGSLMYNVVPGWESNWTVTRLGTTPRGITFNAYGTHSQVQGVVDAKDQLIQDLKALDLEMLPQDKCVNTTARLGEVAEVGTPANPSPLVDMHNKLVERIERMSAVDSFLKIDLPEATVASGPFLEKAARTSNFKSAFYLSNVKDAEGKATVQLQYAQKSMVDFFQRLDCITCPGLSRGADGCYPEVVSKLDQCVVDTSLDPSCSEKPYISWPHIQAANLEKVA